MLDLKSRDDLQRLIDERLGESLTLEYKASAALNKRNEGRMELVKDVTALANSDGGQIIYGIPDGKNGVPNPLDGGVDCTVITPEWIEQVIDTNASPRVQGLRIAKIELDPGTPVMVAYVITVPQATSFAPHQNQYDNKYYRRFELRSVPMHDYEIRDVLRRATTPELWIDWNFGAGKTTKISFTPGHAISDRIELVPIIHNRSREPAVYAVINMYIDDLFHVVVGNGLPPMRPIEGPDTHRLIGRQLSWGPPRLPIFYECPSLVTSVPFEFVLGEDSIRYPDFYLGYEIFAPGFSVEKFVHVIQNPRGTLEIFEK